MILITCMQHRSPNSKFNIIINNINKTFMFSLANSSLNESQSIVIS